MNTPHPAIPIIIDPTLLEQARKVRQSIDALLGQHLSPRTCMIIHYHDLQALTARGHLIAVDLTIDLAYLTPEDPRLPGLVTLDSDALAARTRDMIAMRSSRLN